MFKSISKVLFVALFLVVAPSQSFAVPGVSVGLMAGPNLTFPSVPTLPGIEVSGGIGFSVGPSVGLGPIEASLLYSSYKTTATILTVESSNTSKSLDIPVLYRFGAGPVGIGLGGFYSLSMESGSTSDDNNYGLVGSARVTIPGGLFVDGRFNLGLKDSSGSKVSAAAVLLGFNFL